MSLWSTILLLIGSVGCGVLKPISPIVCDPISIQRRSALGGGSKGHFIGRRMYKVDYKTWGWIRKPKERWSNAKLSILNEQTCLTPDRKLNRIGFDNNYEYSLEGYFSGQTVYEPASNQFYPEFVLLQAVLLSVAPVNIYRYKEQLNPNCRLLVPPCP
ncbi:MAG: hypothetical protein JMM79_01195 [Candidatus Xiphinematobacter sp.]|nr:MAG: hypothetical protein JMM79_01195 [Candidatus Xiphinematobacter sp.]